jgi:hypothetical protein
LAVSAGGALEKMRKKVCATSRAVFGMTPHLGSNSCETTFTARRMSTSEKL